MVTAQVKADRETERKRNPGRQDGVRREKETREIHMAGI